MRISALSHWLLEALWPRRCPACGLPVAEPGADWCEGCGLALAELAGRAYCPACGVDASPLVIRDARCPSCRGRSLPYRGLVRVGVHTGPLRRAIVRFKYHRQEKLDRALAKLLLAAVEGASWFGGVELVVPVPSHWTRRLQRGYDHVGLLARELATLSGKRFGQALEAARRIRPQVGLSFAQRRENVRGAFRAGGWTGRCRGAVCLVDDVTTTGATLHEAGATLARAGLGPVYSAVLAKAGLLDDPLGGP